MDDKGFNVIGVRKDGLIHGYARKSDMIEGKLQDYIIDFGDSERFLETTSLIEVLKAFEKSHIIFVLVFGKVGGIVTRGDLQKYPVMMWLFGIISLIEMQLLRIIRNCQPNDIWIDNLLEEERKIIENRFKSYKKSNAEIDRAECLNLLEKGEIFINDITILKKLNIQKEQYEKFFENLKNLRNKVAHQQNIITRDWPENIDLVRKAEDFLGKCEEFENK